jgi:L-lactate utilization protein LutB
VEVSNQGLITTEDFAVPASEERLNRTVAALAARNLTVHVVETAADARALIRGLLPRNKEILTAVSMTLQHSGILEDIDESGEFQSMRHRLAGDLRTRTKLSAAPDVVVGSVQAVTEDGILVAGSDRGAMLGPYAAGATQVFWIVGVQKIVPNLETALNRIRTHCLALETQRIRAQSSNGAPPSESKELFVGRILIMEREYYPNRGTVILVREPIGH